MPNAYPSPNMQWQHKLQKLHEEYLQQMATQARVLRDEAEAKAKANEAKAKGEG